MDKLAVCFYGYTDAMPAMKKGRIEGDLSCKQKKGVVYRFVSYEGDRYSFTEYLRVILKGATELKETTYRDKTEYRVCYPNSMIVPLNKTQYAFCKYLWENGFADDVKAEAYQQAEERKKQEEAARLEEQQRRENEEIKKRIDERKQYNAHVISLCSAVCDAYPKAVAIVRKYTDKYYRKYMDKFYGSDKPISVRLFHVPALILNWKAIMDDDVFSKYAEEDLRNYLLTHNSCSRKLFTLFTGIKLPANNKGTYDAVTSWLQNPTVKEEI